MKRYLGLVLILLPLIVSEIKDSSAETLTLTDKLGRRISLSVPVKRGVLLQTYEFIPALGLWERVVGVSRHAEEECDIFRVALRKDSIQRRPAKVGSGTDINVESLLAHKPEVIITWSFYPQHVQFLERKGFTVIAIFPNDIEKLYSVTRLHGKIFGKEKRAEEVIAEMEKIFQLIKERVAKIPKQRRVKAIYVMGTPTRVACGESLPNSVLELTGAINPASELKTNYSDVPLERIIQWNPDVIFIWGFAKYDEKALYENPQWRMVKAVQNKRVYKLPHMSTWSPRLAVIALIMAEKLYPEYFKDIDVTKTIDDFYKRVFNLSIDEIRKYGKGH